MKRIRKLIVLFVVFILLIAAYVLTQNLAEKRSSSDIIKVSDATIDNIAKISISGHNNVISLIKEGEDWIYEGDTNYPVNQVLAVSLAQKITSLTATSKIEHPENLIDYGLDTPEKTIKAVLFDGSEIVLETGDINAVTQELYLKSNDGCIYLVSATFNEAFDLTKESFLQKEIIPYVTPVEVIITAQGDSLKLTKDDDGNWKANGEAVSTEKANELCSSIAGISWIDCIAYDATEKELVDAGFDPSAATVYVKGDDERDFKIIFGNNIGDEIYAKFEDSAMFYTVNSDISEYLITDADKLK